jgi:hypothetical protein
MRADGKPPSLETLGIEVSLVEDHAELVEVLPLMLRCHVPLRGRDGLDLTLTLDGGHRAVWAAAAGGPGQLPGHEVSGDLGRQTFATPRAAEFFELRALQAQTGQPSRHFGAVLIEELTDNALDAAESTWVNAEVSLAVAEADGLLSIEVGENGPGMTGELLDRSR